MSAVEVGDLGKCLFAPKLGSGKCYLESIKDYVKCNPYFRDFTDGLDYAVEKVYEAGGDSAQVLAYTREGEIKAFDAGNFSRLIVLNGRVERMLKPLDRWVP